MGTLDFTAVPSDPELVERAVAQRPPTASDDASSGFFAGSFWIDNNENKVYFCTDPTVASAVWYRVKNSFF
jgi:hypothetical protein